MDPLIGYLDSIYPLSESLKTWLESNLKSKLLNKKEYLLKSGHVSRDICFIAKGLLRCFYQVDNKEVSSWFMKEGDVIVSVESFFKQTISYESIQALEDSLVFYITYDELQYVFNNYLEFNFIGRVLIQHYYTLSEQRLFSLRMQRAPDRYKYLLNNFPELILRVPSKYLASYLGIAEPTLSSIKSII
jgi:CRP-like cAMP-binding protein